MKKRADVESPKCGMTWPVFEPQASRPLRRRSGKIKQPDCADLVKLSTANELAPYDPDWFYIRCAAILRHLYLRPTGMLGLRRIFSRKQRNGVRPSHRALAHSSVIRKALQQLESMGMCVKVETGLGQPGSISALVQPSGGTGVEHRKGATAALDRGDRQFGPRTPWSPNLALSFSAACSARVRLLVIPVVTAAAAAAAAATLALAGPTVGGGVVPDRTAMAVACVASARVTGAVVPSSTQFTTQNYTSECGQTVTVQTIQTTIRFVELTRMRAKWIQPEVVVINFGTPEGLSGWSAKVRGSNPTSGSRLLLSRLEQPGSILTLVLPSGGMAAMYRKGVTS
ncbi:hypothetical protein T265_09807 [Opisthorchis viverrini]|uniref:Ribosomal protein S19e n=1 Tax=Opisthorchis viverrini TaxID=6198 RepID=A0A075A3N8_OPIVI|nr:hypothetical protein T265_09807 [Opisthorchis viverrini]KER22014.1 hypothetical protein T265_09807 [Opisthorchis viverrini]